MSNIREVSTLEYYNYWEQNEFQASKGPAYSVKVSDKDGNIITLEKDGSLYACVGLELVSGVLSLIDKAHDNSVLAEIEFPNAGQISNCRFDKDSDSILFDILTLNGETQTVELDVASIVEIYEAGQGIEIGEKDATTGRRPISIKLAEGENILQVSDEGLSISDSITTDDELAAAISGKADVDYVNELFGNISGITSDVEQIWNVIGTDIDDPTIDERIDSKADLDEFNDLENEVGDLTVNVNSLSGDVNSITDRIDDIENVISDYGTDISELKTKVDGVEDNIESINNVLTDVNSNIADLETEVSNDKVRMVKITSGLDVTVKEAYQLKNALDETLGEQINIYKDSSIESIEYTNVGEHGESGQFLKFVYIDASGDEKITYIDLSEVVIEAEYADGLKVVDGKVYVNIDPSSDEYLTVSQNGLKLSGINQKFEEQSNAINSLENGLETEKEERSSEDNRLSNLISDETEARIAGDNAVENKIDEKVNEEKERALLAEATLTQSIDEEKENRIAGDNSLNNLIDAEKEARIEADDDIRQYAYDSVNSISGRVEGISNRLEDEISERVNEDNEIKADVEDIKENYASKEYVNEKYNEAIETSVTSAVTLSNQYADSKDDEVKEELKLYCDSGYTDLQHDINDNATKINAISNLKGVSGDDISNYDDTGNGILDVLHKEFHEYVDSQGTIKEIKYEDGNLIIVYHTEEGDKETIIPFSDIVDLSNYYTKDETNEEIDNAVDEIVGNASQDYNTLEKIENKVENGYSSLTELIEKLGYDDNDTLVTTNTHEVAFGEYNISNTGDSDADKTIFSVGNGTDDENRKNAFEVRKDGTVYMWIEGDYMNVNRLLSMLAHETY